METLLESLLIVSSTLAFAAFVIALPVAFFSGRAGWWRITKCSLFVTASCAVLLVVRDIVLPSAVEILRKVQ
jgi:hypothetical protein